MEKIKSSCVAFIRSNSWMGNRFNHGDYNGYVAVPPTNRYAAMNYIDLDMDVHGGLTFGEMAVYQTMDVNGRALNPEWIGKKNPIFSDGEAEFITENTDIGYNWTIYGFDTAHFMDNSDEWDRNAVINETIKLLRQFENDKESDEWIIRKE